jgi:predicted NAD-dependent protein-ADP-ribosyltransferase YbiA (DUF1768 family)
VLLKEGFLIVAPETGAEAAELAAWKAGLGGHVLAVTANAGSGVALADLGPRPDACNEPLNVVSNSADPAARMISNFAEAPFELDGRPYRSVESFWQGLKFVKESERRRIAALPGREACAEGTKQAYGATVHYEGEDVPVGTWQHWQLMERACRAKFTQDAEARWALLSTGERPLTHRVRRDSRTIPGVLMADIWMRIRRLLREEAG